jgi:hypothetical protein
MADTGKMKDSNTEKLNCPLEQHPLTVLQQYTDQQIHTLLKVHIIKSIMKSCKNREAVQNPNAAYTCLN